MRSVKNRLVLFLVTAGVLVVVTTALVPTTRYIALDDSNCFVRNNAMVALGHMGPAAHDAVPALVRLWEKAEYVAGDALERIAPETAKHTHPLVWTEDWRTRAGELKTVCANVARRIRGRRTADSMRANDMVRRMSRTKGGSQPSSGIRR
jgi:hypothetical protein